MRQSVLLVYMEHSIIEVEILKYRLFSKHV